MSDSMIDDDSSIVLSVRTVHQSPIKISANSNTDSSGELPEEETLEMGIIYL